MLLIPIVSAELINTSIVVPPDVNLIWMIENGYTMLNSGFASRMYNDSYYTEPDNAIILTKFAPASFSEGVANYIFTTPTGTITGTISKMNTGWFTGNEIVSMGAATKTIPYTRIPGVPGFADSAWDTAPPISFVYLLPRHDAPSDTRTDIYFIGDDNNDLLKDAGLYPFGCNFALDTSNAAYTIYDPYTNPIIGVSFSGNLDMDTTLFYGEQDQIISTMNLVKTTVINRGISQPSWYETFGLILKSIVNVLNQLAKIAPNILILIDATLWVATLIFASEVFIGINAFYIGIAIILAIEDSDDLFQAFGKFWKRMMKLYKFYMQLFKDIKKLIQWW